MKIKRILAIVCSAAMLACLLACNDSSDDDSKKETTEETTEVVTEADIESDSESAADSDIDADSDSDFDLNSEDPQELILNILQMGFESSFGENMLVDYEEDTQNYVVSIWQDGLAANLANEAAADAWNTMIDTLVSAVGQMTDPIRQIDSTANITLNILSDENQDDVLLTIYNGEVTFNAAE